MSGPMGLPISHKKPIGVFDSGIGGLSVVKELKRLLPNEDIIYFGDTARLPYGTKSKETVVRFSCEIVRFLTRFKIKLGVVACHTASSFSLPTLRRHFPIPMVGVVQPGARQALTLTRTGRIGVLGTRATIQSGSYEKEIKRLDRRVKVFSQSCPLFVPLVEEGHFNGDITTRIAEQYLAPMARAGVDTVILGCTHYPLLKEVIGSIFGKRVKLVDSAQAVAWQVRDLLEAQNLLANGGDGSTRYFVSDEPRHFVKIGSFFLKDRIRAVRKIRDV
jgi:glutamate racemase